MKNESINSQLYSDVLKGTDFEAPMLHLPYSKNLSALKASMNIAGKTVPNRICYQPMEGQDADLCGCPTELTFSRYNSLAKGGAGIIWIEAVSVCEQGRSNAHQLMIDKNNLDSYKRLVESCKSECLKANGYEPFIALQLNHSGRHSKPNGVPAPITATRIQQFERPGINYSLATDEYLSTLPDLFAEKALLCEKAGLDAVDVKCCHGYLFSELLGAFDRVGIYGGSFENRSRLLLDTVKACKAAVSSTLIACRLNIYDGYSNPHSFGTDKNDYTKYDLTEPLELVAKLASGGVSLLNATMGSPYVNPDVSRPYKKGIDIPKTNALEALHRLFNGARLIHEAFPSLPLVNTGVSGLCANAPYAAAGMLEEGYTDFVGFGRASFAYPSLARDILCGEFDSKKTCVACSGCSTLKKNGLLSGCIIRNPLYKNVFKENIK